MEEHNFKSNIITRRIYLKATLGKGMGVYAAEDIKAGQLIEKCYLLEIDTPIEHLGNLYDYVFNYPKTRKPFVAHVIPLGAGCIYNHDDNHNAHWEDSKELWHFDFIAIKDIKAGQEICTHYGDAYWTQMANRNPQLKKITND